VIKSIFESWLLQTNRRPKILIVDDQPTNIRVLHELFRHDCDVFVAITGQQAIATCLAQQPDLALLDVVMGDLDGYEVCRRLKADLSTSTIPIIFVTGQTQDADEERALDLGAADFITKPIKPAIVQARVRTQLTLKLQSDLLRAMARLDGLTGVSNRRKFDEDIDAAWRQGVREQTPLSLIMLDLDHFKRYNDHYGHQAGDACLQSVSRALSECLRRPYDTIARYGGEEFVCLMPNTGLEGATIIAKKMESIVRSLQIEHLGCDADQVVTISLGVASIMPTAQGNWGRLIKSADQQLYEAKRAGRACVSAIQASSV